MARYHPDRRNGPLDVVPGGTHPIPEHRTVMTEGRPSAQDRRNHQSDEPHDHQTDDPETLPFTQRMRFDWDTLPGFSSFYPIPPRRATIGGLALTL